MSYEAVDKVIRSDIGDATLFSVLLALAFFKNDRTGECFPSTDRIATTARRSPNVVRSAIKRLEQLGYLETKQVPGLRRFFVIHLERLPSKVEPLSDSEPLSDCHPLTEVKPLSEVTGDPCQKCEGTPFRSVRGPLSEVTPEQGIEQGKEQVIEQGSMSPLARASDDLELTLTPEVEKPTAKPKRTKTTVAKPEDVSEQVWTEFLAQRKAKRMTFTDLALKGTRREAEKAGLSLEEAMTMCIERGWGGFREEYVRGAKGGNGYRSTKKAPTCPGDWEKEYKGVDYTRGAVMKEFTPEESARLATLAEEMNF